MMPNPKNVALLSTSIIFLLHLGVKPLYNCLRLNLPEELNQPAALLFVDIPLPKWKMN